MTTDEKIALGKKHLQEWPIKKLVVGFMWNELTQTTDFSAMIVCNEQQRILNEKKYLYHRTFEIGEELTNLQK